MSGLAETSPITSVAPAIPRVTNVVAIIEATALEVCIAGQRACLNLPTARGIVRVLLPTDRFLHGARGERDANGHPFPRQADVRGETNLRVLEADAASIPAGPGTRSPNMPKAERDERCAHAWKLLEGDVHLSVDGAAEVAGVAQTSLIGWIRQHRDQAWQAMQPARLDARRRRTEWQLAARLESAVAMLARGEVLSAKEAAERANVSKGYLSKYLKSRHHDLWVSIRREGYRRRAALREHRYRTTPLAGPVLKPVGQIL